MEFLIHSFSLMLIACLPHFSTTLSVFASSQYILRVAVADWTDTHVIFGYHPNTSSSSTVLEYRDLITGDSDIETIDFPVTQVITYPGNTNATGNIILVKPNGLKKELYRLTNFDVNDNAKFDSDAWGYCFGETNDIVYFSHQTEDKIKKYTISSNSKGPDFATIDNNYEGYRVAYDNQMVKALTLEKNTGISLKIENKTEVDLQTIYTVTDFTHQNGTSALPFYDNFAVYEDFSISMGKILLSEPNRIRIFNLNGTLENSFGFVGKILCSCYFHEFLGFVETNGADRRVKVMDIHSEEIITDDLVAFQSLDLCQMKYLPSLQKLTLHPFDSDVIYEVIEYILNNTTNTTNMTNATNTTNMTSTTNTTNITNNTGISNKTNNPTDSAEIPAEPEPEIQSPQDQTIKDIEQVISSDGVQTSMNASTIILSLTMGSPLSNIGLRPLFSFIDDLWPYSYHQVVYRQIVEFFVADINILSVLRINPFESLDVSPVFINFTENEKNYRRQIQAYEKYPQEHTFILALREVYIFNLGICIAIFVLYILLKMLFRYCILKKWSGQVYKDQFQCSSLVISFFLPNTSKVLFFAFIGINTPYQFNAYDKLNLLLLYMALFVWLSFNIYVYLIIYQMLRNQRNDVHEYSKKGWRGMAFQIFFINLRCCFRSIVHGFLLHQHQTKLILLIVIDILLLLGSIKFRKTYRTCLTFLLHFGYQLAFLSLDGTLYSDTYNPILHFDYDYIFLGIFLSIIGLSFLQATNLIILNLIEFIRENFELKSNRIAPKPSHKPQGSSKQKKKEDKKSKKEKQKSQTQIQKPKKEKALNSRVQYIVPTRCPELEYITMNAIVPRDF